MEENKAGFVGWKIGQTPNLVAAFAGMICCFLGLWNFHLYREELEKELGISSDLHWVKVIFATYGLLDLEMLINKLEAKYGIETKEGILTFSFMAAIPILWLLLPIQLVKLLERANAIKQAMDNARA